MQPRARPEPAAGCLVEACATARHPIRFPRCRRGCHRVTAMDHPPALRHALNGKHTPACDCTRPRHPERHRERSGIDGRTRQMQHEHRSVQEIGLRHHEMHVLPCPSNRLPGRCHMFLLALKKSALVLLKQMKALILSDHHYVRLAFGSHRRPSRSLTTTTRAG